MKVDPEINRRSPTPDEKKASNRIDTWLCCWTSDLDRLRCFHILPDKVWHPTAVCVLCFLLFLWYSLHVFPEDLALFRVWMSPTANHRSCSNPIRKVCLCEGGLWSFVVMLTMWRWRTLMLLNWREGKVFMLLLHEVAPALCCFSQTVARLSRGCSRTLLALCLLYFYLYIWTLPVLRSVTNCLLSALTQVAHSHFSTGSFYILYWHKTQKRCSSAQNLLLVYKTFQELQTRNLCSVLWKCIFCATELLV